MLDAKFLPFAFAFVRVAFWWSVVKLVEGAFAA